MGKYFGTDGIRGKAERFSTDFVARIAKGIVVGAEKQGVNELKIMIGGDTRESTEWIIRDFEKAFETLGVEYGNVGVLSTPGINYAFYELGFDYAVDITASHNPADDNGVKVFMRDKNCGAKLGEAERLVIEETIEKNEPYDLVATEIREDIHQEALDCYLNGLRKYVGEVNLSGIKIGLDCANGATSVVGGKIFEELGAEVVVINNNEHFGRTINQDAGSTHPEGLQQLVKERGLDFGAAFDGDGDRCMMVDERGELVDGDQMIAVLAEFLKLPKIVVTVMANQGLAEWAKQNDISMSVSAVGDQNVAEMMKKEDIQIGGEQSGHIILPGQSMGDGMLTALMMAKAIKASGGKLSELAGRVPKFPQIMHNIAATSTEKKLLEKDAEIQGILANYAEKLAGMKGKLLVRPSGTEDLIRITVWGEKEEEIKSVIEEIEEKLKKTFSERSK